MAYPPPAAPDPAAPVPDPAEPIPALPELPVPAEAQNLEQHQALALIPDVLRPGQGLSPSTFGDALERIPSVVDAAAMVLVRVNARALENDRAELKQENRELQKEIRAREKELAVLTTQNAVLVQQLRSLRHSDRLRGVLKTMGGISVGAGLSTMVDHTAFGLVVSAIGIVFVVAGWVRPPEPEAEGK